MICLWSTILLSVALTAASAPPTDPAGGTVKTQTTGKQIPKSPAAANGPAKTDAPEAAAKAKPKASGDAKQAPASATPASRPTLRLNRRSKPKRPEAKPKASSPVSSKSSDNESLVLPERHLPSPEERKGPSDLDHKLLDDLGQSLEKADDDETNPLLRIGRRMRSVEERLAQLSDPTATIEIQKRIVADLDKLLRPPPGSKGSSKQQKKNQKPKSHPAAQKIPQQQSMTQKQSQPTGRPQEMVVPGTVAREQTGNVRQVKDIWGHLSAFLRQEMSQYAKEEFLPKYRDLLERYYSTIAEESRMRSE